jgi:DNA polymerase
MSQNADLTAYLEHLQRLYGEDFQLSEETASALRNFIAPDSQELNPPPAAPQKIQASPAAAGADFSGPLGIFYEEIKNCQSCPLGKSRKNFVFGIGNPDADLMLIGEAPGAEEDAQGIPFVGRAGQLLTKILAAINFSRDEVYIANILKCRPPNNRDPLPNEVDACRPYLDKQIEMIKPKIILLLGRVAAQTLLETKDSLSSMRRRTHSYMGIDVFVTYHPAALLRNPHWKRPTWEDVQRVRAKYDELTGNTNE